jgi:hypothetical protein
MNHLVIVAYANAFSSIGGSDPANKIVLQAKQFQPLYYNGTGEEVRFQNWLVQNII